MSRLSRKFSVAVYCLPRRSPQGAVRWETLGTRLVQAGAHHPEPPSRLCRAVSWPGNKWIGKAGASWSLVDCEQSLFSSKIHGRKRKTRKRENVSVTWDRRCREPLVAWRVKRETALEARHSGDGVILLVGLRSYDAHLSVTLVRDMQRTLKLCCNVCLLRCDSYGRDICCSILNFDLTTFLSVLCFTFVLKDCGIRRTLILSRAVWPSSMNIFERSFGFSCNLLNHSLYLTGYGFDKFA